MICPKIICPGKLTLLFLAVLILPAKNLAQLSQSYFLGLHVGGGPAVPLGCLQANSELGTYKWGYNVNADLEWFLKRKYALSIGFNRGAYNVGNPNLVQKIITRNPNGKAAEKSVNYEADILLTVTRFSFGVSKYFRKNNVLIQPTLEFSTCFASNDFNETYRFYDSTIAPTPTVETRCIYVSEEPSVRVTLVPGVNLSYMAFRTSWFEGGVNLGLNYCFLTPKFVVYERVPPAFSSTAPPIQSSYLTLKGPLSMLNIHLGLVFYFKKN